MRRAIVLLLVLLLSGCIFQSPQDLITPAASSAPRYTGLQLEALGSYSAEFTASFEGESNWWYHATLAAAGGQQEFDIELEGLPPAQDAGDVRVVEAQGVRWLKGQATDGACWRVPAGEPARMRALMPDDFLAAASLASLDTTENPDVVLGRQTVRVQYTGNLEPAYSRVDVTLWTDALTGSVLRYQFRLVGADPVFGAGEGTLTGDFEVVSLEGVTIPPIEGCDSPFPLPEDAEDLYLLADYVGYRTRLTEGDLVAFLASTLAAQGWEPAADTEAIPGTSAMSFRRGDVLLEVFLQNQGPWTEVRIFQAPAS